MILKYVRFQNLAVFCLHLLIGSCVVVSLSAQTGSKSSLTTDDVLNIRSFSFQNVTDDGRFVAGTIGARKDRLGVDHMRFGDPTYVSRSLSELVYIDTKTKRTSAIFDEKVQSRSLRWSPDGGYLAFFLRKDDNWVLSIFDREKDKIKEIDLKTDKRIASNSFLIWKTDGSGIILALRDAGWQEQSRKEFLDLSEGPVIVRDSKKPFLAWDEVRSRTQLHIPAIVSLNGDVRELLPESRITGLRQSKNGQFITYSRTYPIKTSYTRTGGSENELFVLDLKNGEPRSVREKSTQRFNPFWNNSGESFAFVEKGDVFVQSVFENEAVNLTKEYRTRVSEEDTSKLSYSMMRWNPDDSNLLIGSQKGYHLLDVQSNEIELVYEKPEDEENAPNINVVNWSPDGSYLYMTYSAKDKWERGLVKYDLSTKQMTTLIKDRNLYRRWQFSENGESIFYSFSNGDLPDNLYMTDGNSSAPVQLTDLNPWIKDRKTTKSELIQYLDIDGKERFGILYYPVDYEEGKKYPLVCEIYERFFDNGWHNNMNLITNAGFFGFRPSVDFEEGFPGEAWMKSITTGINKLIERGLVDGDKLGVHGTSYGGYATNLLITQTDRFAAAINISGKVNIISFLGDSPKIGVRNYYAAESGQDRIGATLWEQPQKYIQHSAIMFADRIETPLLMLSGEGDWNVPATNQREMYYALRRLDKEVEWVHYMNGGHGAGAASTVEDFHDHWNRIIGWYTKHFNKKDEDKKNKH